MDVAAVARRARTENFPVASVLFPRRLRPHLRAIYGFARLVDILGDEVEGDRFAALRVLPKRYDHGWPRYLYRDRREAFDVAALRRLCATS